MKMRHVSAVRVLCVGLICLVCSFAQPVSATPFTEISDGQKCGKLNRIVEDGMFYYQCTKKGKFKVWEFRGVVATKTTTTTVAPRNRTTQVPNLQEFVNSYGKSVVTIYCGNSSGSGVSLAGVSGGSMSELGAQSFVVTNMHVVIDCIKTAGWRDNRVTILHQGVEYAGYATAWPSFADYRSGAKADLAGVMTTGLIPTATYDNVRAPQLGDAVVAIGSAGGVPNVTTRGEVAGVTARDIISTSPAGHGSSGGALFNNDGQLLGFIYSANASLVNVIPIPQLCGTILNCAAPIAYVP
jgi:S1-C subfamily serine protease